MKALNASDVWDDGLEKFLTHVLMRSKGKRLSVPLPTTWIHQYSQVYELFTHGTNEDKMELYNNIKSFLHKEIELILDTTSSYRSIDLLAFYLEQWRSLSRALKVMLHITKYMHRFWILQHDEYSSPRIYPIDALSILLWRDALQKHVSCVLTALLDVIDGSRRGENVDLSIVHGVIEVFVDLGTPLADGETVPSCNDDTAVRLRYFREHFFCYYLERTRSFYRDRASNLLSECNVADFMKRVEVSLEAEEVLIERLLPVEERDLAKQCVVEVLVKDYMESIHTEFDRMIEEGRSDDLRRMYRFSKYSPQHLRDMAALLRTHVKKEGSKIIEAANSSLPLEKTTPHVAETLGSSSGALKKTLGVVQQLVDLLDQMISLNELCFQDSVFVKAVDDAFRSFSSRMIGCYSLAELLSHACDAILRNTRLSESASEKKFERLVKFFGFLEDKDLFHEYYRRQLAERLLRGRSRINEEAEHTMICHLRENAGHGFTNKLEGMFKDVARAEDTASEFASYREEKNVTLKVDLSVQVLARPHWPLTATAHVTLCEPLAHAVEMFHTFYHKTHPTRKLSWVHSLGTVSLVAHLGKKFELLCSTYQACVLYLFNREDSLTFGEVCSRIGVPAVELAPVVGALMTKKYPILRKRDSSAHVSHREGSSEICLSPSTTAVSYRNYDSSSNNISCASESPTTRASKRRRTASGNGPSLRPHVPRNSSASPRNVPRDSSVSPRTVAIEPSEEASVSPHHVSKSTSVSPSPSNIAGTRGRAASDNPLPVLSLLPCNGERHEPDVDTCERVRKVMTAPSVPSDGRRQQLLDENDVLEVNNRFTCRQVRLTLHRGCPLIATEIPTAREAVQVDRSHQVDAALVRTMKSRRRLSHANLFAEVTKQLMQFKPCPKLVKQRIESLIDREFVERDPNDSKFYVYVA
eukprot:Rmarinus@m.27895